MFLGSNVTEFLERYKNIFDDAGILNEIIRRISRYADIDIDTAIKDCLRIQHEIGIGWSERRRESIEKEILISRDIRSRIYIR